MAPSSHEQSAASESCCVTLAETEELISTGMGRREEGARRAQAHRSNDEGKAGRAPNSRASTASGSSWWVSK